MMSPREPSAAYLETMHARHAKDLRRFLNRYLSSDEDIDDCVQEAFLRVWERSRRGSIGDNLRAYLFTTALNVVRDKRRRENVRQKGLHVDLSENEDDLRSREQEADFYWREALRRIEKELPNLSPATRRVFLMLHVEHLSYEEIAAKLGISRRTVERHIERALDHLKHVVEDVMTGTQND
jgi:RNA polymerase sigma factor (sigma-70 family)